MKTTLAVSGAIDAADNWPDAASLAALRAWFEGVPSCEAVARYLPRESADGWSSRTTISRIKRTLIAIANCRGRGDLAQLLAQTRPGQPRAGQRVSEAIESLRRTRVPEPLIGDDVGRWLAPRLAAALLAAGIKTLADLTLRVSRRRRWWTSIPGLGKASARHVEQFFAQHSALTERARALTSQTRRQALVPWERLVIPEDVDGTSGTFRAPRASCALSADNDYQAVSAWLSLLSSTNLASQINKPC